MRSKPLPLKLFYQGPMFRYERSQKGRQRQFHQFGAELLGVAEPLGDVEVIAMAAQILGALGIGDKVTLQLNTLGDVECREGYRTKLVEYLQDYRDDLSEDSLARLERNPLRILDSKDEGDRAAIKGAPRLTDHLNEASTAFFEDLQAGLEIAGVAYELNPGLVRGLDYYCHTAFEFVTDTLGAQGTVLAGGRYDGLIQLMGGPATPGIGWAAGVERLSLMIGEPAGQVRAIAVIPGGEDTRSQALSLAQQLRRGGFTIDLGYTGNLKKRLNRADKAGASAAVILKGQDTATVRDMETGEQTDVALAGLEDHLQQYR
jgi:histidyl-tRNA synthetase